ncbi:hypothetical protein ACCQ08_03115 [Comamonas sp. SY3]|uniref:hypothetical protein n=1 Tax=Comamonas sp. SY3 TaxID=3243601 RepID=UPI003593F7EE
MGDSIHIDTCAAHAGGRCNCGEALAALVDSTPPQANCAWPSRSTRGALMLGPVVLVLAAVWVFA